MRVNEELARATAWASRKDARLFIQLGQAPANRLSANVLRADALCCAHASSSRERRSVRREGVGGPGPSVVREECSGPLLDILDCCLRFIERHTRQYEVVTGTRREGLPEYPDTVIREAVLNALAHRDSGLAGATTDITVWDDRIEVQSPGPLAGHITVENMRERALQPQSKAHERAQGARPCRGVRRGCGPDVPRDGSSPHDAAGHHGDLQFGHRDPSQSLPRQRRGSGVDRVARRLLDDEG